MNTNLTRRFSPTNSTSAAQPEELRYDIIVSPPMRFPDAFNVEPVEITTPLEFGDTEDTEEWAPEA